MLPTCQVLRSGYDPTSVRAGLEVPKPSISLGCHLNNLVVWSPVPFDSALPMLETAAKLI